MAFENGDDAKKGSDRPCSNEVVATGVADARESIILGVECDDLSSVAV